MKTLSTINFVAAVQGIFLAYMLINTRSSKREYRILAALVVTISLSLLGAVLGASGYYKEYPHLIRIGDPLVFLFGPLLYFYIYQRSRGNMPQYSLLHFVPFAVYVGFQIPFYALSGEEKIAHVDRIFLSDKQPIIWHLGQVLTITSCLNPSV